MSQLVLTRYPLIAAGIASVLGPRAAPVRATALADALACATGRRLDLIVAGLECLLPAPATALARLREAAPAARVLVLAGAEHAEHFPTLVRAGTDALLLHDTDLDQVSRALAATAAGESWLDPQVQMVLLRSLDREPAPPPELTPREMEVLQRVARGLSNKAIGRELQLQEGTVKTYLRRLRKRMGARDRTHAVVHAMRIGLVDLG